jgi:kinetochore protein NDC80
LVLTRNPFSGLQISKSALFAVGAPHTWPAVLAALNWLVELLTYNERTEEQASSSSTTRVGAPMPGTLEDPDAVIKREFFEHVRSSYQYWLARNDNM